ncbi:MAG: hypothetical protein M3464_12390, partial [Chloroflexota bacterium]|nr:hypothetical protein [Chloroflexota bacterium]
TATVDLREGIERGRTRDFFGLNLLQDRRPEFYGLIPATDIYTSRTVAPAVRSPVAVTTGASEPARAEPLAVGSD